MRRLVLAAMMAGALVSLLGCNPRVGLIVLDTNPQGATVYVNETKVGETPVKFEFNMEKPVTMRILKEGYQPATEQINVGWVKSEYYQGHYAKGDFMLEGKMQRGYQVLATRNLTKLEGQAPMPPPPPAPPTVVTPPPPPPPPAVVSPPPPPVAAHRCSDPAPAPRFQVGEKWTWRNDRGEENTDEVIEVDGETTRMRKSNGDVVFLDKDRVLQKVHLKNGDVLTAPGANVYPEIGKKMMEFPLVPGKSWEWRFTRTPPASPIRSYTQRRTVVACEEVTTTAGRFSAFKIEVHDRDVTAMTDGKALLWYAPDVKVVVRRQIVASDYWRNSPNWELVKYERR